MNNWNSLHLNLNFYRRWVVSTWSSGHNLSLPHFVEFFHHCLHPMGKYLVFIHLNLTRNNLMLSSIGTLVKVEVWCSIKKLDKLFKTDLYLCSKLITVIEIKNLAYNVILLRSDKRIWIKGLWLYGHKFITKQNGIIWSQRCWSKSHEQLF